MGRYCEADINECKEQKPCDQICHNTFGSYYCQCKEDFILLSDGQSCRKESKSGINLNKMVIKSMQTINQQTGIYIYTISFISSRFFIINFISFIYGQWLQYCHV